MRAACNHWPIERILKNRFQGNAMAPGPRTRAACIVTLKGLPVKRLIARRLLIVGRYGIPFFTKFSEPFRLSPHLLKPSLLNICYVSASRLCLLKKPLGILITLLSSA
jgi:hypothetical protein